MTPYLIGITGGSGSGKTYFLKSLLNHFKEDEVCLLSQDNYYLDRDKQPTDENGVKNFDTPQSINHKELAHDVAQLKAGNDFERKEYTFNNPDITPKLLKFKAAPIVVVEGLFVMHFPEVNKLLDLRVFIEAKEHIKLKRRIIRDKVERGYDLDDVLYRFEKHVMPSYDKYLGPLRHESDIIVPNNNHVESALNVIVGFLKSKLKE